MYMILQCNVMYARVRVQRQQPAPEPEPEDDEDAGAGRQNARRPAFLDVS